MVSTPQKTAFSVFNGFAPTEGPKALPIAFDFTAANSLDVNLLTENTQGVIQYVQSVWIENQRNPNPLIISFQGTGQSIVAPPYSQGTWPVFSTDQVVLTISSTVNANAIGKIILLNVPMPEFQAGQVTLSPASTIVVNPSLAFYQGTYTNFSSTITAGGVSQTAIAANANRKGFIIQNGVNELAVLSVNFGAAASYANSISLVPGAMFTSADFFTTQSITVVSATTGQTFIAKELA